MNIEIDVLKELFDAKFNPLKDDISQLKTDQSKFFEIVAMQARYGESLENLKKEVKESKDFTKTLSEKFDTRLWTMIILGATALGSLFLNIVSYFVH